MKKLAPLLIFVVACGCARDADKPIAAGNAKTGLLTLPVIVVNGEICGTYSKYELRKGKYQQLGWVRPEHQFTLNKNGTFIWSREKVLREPGVAERWALRSLDYVGTGRWSKEGTLLKLDGSEKIVQEESKPAKSVRFTLHLQIRDKALAPNGGIPTVVYQKTSEQTPHVH